MNPQINFFPDNNSLLEVEYDGKKKSLKYNRLRIYNNSIRNGIVEEVSCRVCDQYLVGTAAAYNGQTSIVFAWNIKNNRLVHITENEHAVAASLIHGYVYSLHYWYGWGIHPHFIFCRVPFGIKNHEYQPEMIDLPDSIKHYGFPCEIDINPKKSTTQEICINLNDSTFFIKI